MSSVAQFTPEHAMHVPLTLSTGAGRCAISSMYSTKLTNNLEPFNKVERFIVSGRWKYEEKRLAASKRGIELTQRESGKFGRPKGTTVSTDDFLVKHSDIVTSLERVQVKDVQPSSA